MDTELVLDLYEKAVMEFWDEEAYQQSLALEEKGPGEAADRYRGDVHRVMGAVIYEEWVEPRSRCSDARKSITLEKEQAIVLVKKKETRMGTAVMGTLPRNSGPE